jgi:hypothetical protein
VEYPRHTLAARTFRRIDPCRFTAYVQTFECPDVRTTAFAEHALEIGDAGQLCTVHHGRPQDRMAEFLADGLLIARGTHFKPAKLIDEARICAPVHQGRLWRRLGATDQTSAAARPRLYDAKGAL